MSNVDSLEPPTDLISFINDAPSDYLLIVETHHWWGCINVYWFVQCFVCQSMHWWPLWTIIWHLTRVIQGFITSTVARYTRRFKPAVLRRRSNQTCNTSTGGRTSWWGAAMLASVSVSALPMASKRSTTRCTCRSRFSLVCAPFQLENASLFFLVKSNSFLLPRHLCVFLFYLCWYRSVRLLWLWSSFRKYAAALYLWRISNPIRWVDEPFEWHHCWRYYSTAPR